MFRTASKAKCLLSVHTQYELKLPKSDLIVPSAGYFVVALGAGVVGRNWPDGRFLEDN